MTDTEAYTITESVVQTGYIDQDGKFHPVDEAEAPVAAFVQTGEDVVEPTVQ